MNNFQISITDDDDLLVWRNTEHGLTNIIINKDGIAYSYIAKNKSTRILKFNVGNQDIIKLIAENG